MLEQKVTLEYIYMNDSIDIKKHLEKSVKGMRLLKSYEVNKSLSESDRGVLTRLLVDDFKDQNNRNMSVHEMQVYAEGLVSCFSTETMVYKLNCLINHCFNTKICYQTLSIKFGHKLSY